MLLGSSGKSAGNPIGQGTREDDQSSADQEISTTIRSRFAADAELRTLGLRIETHKRVVTLRGIAKSFTQRDRAIRMAGDVSGVLRVDSQLTVNTR